MTAVSESNEPGFRVVLTTSDLEDVEVVAEPSVTILDAAAQAGLTLPSLCRKGACGVCRATLVSGEVDRGEYLAEALPQELAEVGGILLCSATASSDVEISVPYERSRIVDGVLPDRLGVISVMETVATDTVRLVVDALPDETVGAGLQFEAGQFVNVRRSDSVEERAYSLANVGNWDGVAEFYIKLRPGGQFSQYLRSEAGVGDELVMRGPSGAFGLRENGLRPRWFICGGTGMAPLMSMVRRMAEWQDPQAVLVILGVESEAEVFGVDLLGGLELPGGIEIAVSVRNPGEQWAGLTGTSVDVMRERLAMAEEPPDIYLCGSPGFLAAARDCAEAAGVPEDQVFAELILAN